jgi:hypothetical protein
VRWRWVASKKFIMRSVYLQLTEDDNGQNFQGIWKAKIPHENQNLYVDGCTKNYSD